ncbi:MAG: VacJ family lipoprotein [Sphingomonadaceae bacterium]
MLRRKTLLRVAAGLGAISWAAPTWATLPDNDADIAYLAVAPIAVDIASAPLPLVVERGAFGPQEAVATDPAPAIDSLVEPSRVAPTRGDPLEPFNRRMFALHTKLDRAIFRPLSRGAKNLPRPFRDAIRNFFRNLREPFVIINDLLQLRFKQAGQSFTRLFVNSVLGIGGLFDVAGKDGLKAHSNSFGGTLARWGVGPGPYLFIPFAGPTTLRDLLGGQAEGLVLPFAVGKPFNRIDYNVGKAVLTGLDQRIEQDAALNALLSGAVDPYATLRSSYLQNREAEVRELKGEPVDATPNILDSPLDDPGAEALPPAPLPQPPPESPPQASESSLDLGDVG